jgi:5'-nucleotidase
MSISRPRPNLQLLSSIAVALLLFSTAPVGQTPAGGAYRILVTNDDSVWAPGILALAEALKSVGEVTIIAPADNQSGKGHSISITDPIYADPVMLPGDVRAIAVTATPASCVKLAVHELMKHRPNLVVSGINRGYNLGVVAYVSGTVGAAREAALMGIPSIAASLDDAQTDYGPAAKIVRQIAELVRKNGLDAGAFLNVNVPGGSAGAIKGIQLTRQSMLMGVERFEEQRTPRGRRYFWSVWNEPAGDAEGTDAWATAHGYVAVTPLRVGEFDPKTYEEWRTKLAIK